MSVEKSISIVTGGAQGLGYAIVRELLTEDYKVCIADINEEKGNAITKELQKEFGEPNVTFHLCDVSQKSQIKSVFDYTLQKFNGIDLLVNNAGIGYADPDKMIAVNLMSVIYGCELAIEYMGKNRTGKGGTVLNMASTYGLIPSSRNPIYSASKHAVVGLTRSYGTDCHYKENGIMFYALCPCFVDTPLLEKFIAESLELGIDLPKLIDPVYAAKGVMKLIIDKKNGATLMVTREDKFGYKYIGLGELEGFEL